MELPFFHFIASLEGRLLKVYVCSVNKVRSDYARLFITTPAIEEINGVEDFLIGGTKFSIRLVEDLDFGLADMLVSWSMRRRMHLIVQNLYACMMMRL